MTTVSVTIRGIEQKRRDLKRMKERLADLSPATVPSAAELVAFMETRFQSGTDPDGRAWPGGTTPDGGDNIETGELLSSLNARGENQGITWGAGADHASFAQAARAFAPVAFVGGRAIILESGPGGELWRGILERIKTYILTGEVR